MYQLLIENIEPKERDKFLGSLFTIDEDMIVLKALDGIANHPTKKQIIIAAGGFHIKDLEPYLEKMGFIWDGQEGKEVKIAQEDDIHAKSNFEFNDEIVNLQERMLTAKTVEDMREILGEDICSL